MSHAVGMIEMGGDTCLVPFLDIYPVANEGSDLVNYGTSGSKFFGYWQPPAGYSGYWTALWFPTASGFPFDNDYSGLAKTAADFGGDVRDPVALTCEVAPTGVTFYSETYYYAYPPDGDNGWHLFIQVSDHFGECEIIMSVARNFYGASSSYLWEVTWVNPTGTWSGGDTIGASFDPLTGEQRMYVNDTLITTGFSVINFDLGQDVTDGYFEGEQIYSSGFGPFGDRPTKYPVRWTASRGMLSSATGLCV